MVYELCLLSFIGLDGEVVVTTSRLCWRTVTLCVNHCVMISRVAMHGGLAAAIFLKAHHIC